MGLPVCTLCTLVLMVLVLVLVLPPSGFVLVGSPAACGYDSESADAATVLLECHWCLRG